MYILDSEKTTTFLTIILVVVFVVFMYYVSYSIEEGFQEYFGSGCIDFIPFKTSDTYETKKGTIFVSIASYRDSECSLTVQSIFGKAKNPQNIFLGICEQNKKDLHEEECFSPKVQKYKDNIRYHNLDYLEAKGPTYARYFCSKLARGEEYFLQIDSHTFFEQDWDVNLIEMLEKCRYSEKKSEKHPYGPNGSKKPVLSAYPPTDSQMKLSGFPVMDSGKLSKNNKIPVFLAGLWDIKSDKPIRSPKPFIAAGFMFCDLKFLKEIPYDPNLSNLFVGEETLFSARMFTNGYDIFAPNIKICSHHYSRPGPLYFKDIPNHSDCRVKAEKRALFLLKMSSKKSVADEFLRDLHHYGLGSFRSINDFWNASGIDFSEGSGGSIEGWGPGKTVSEKYSGWNFNKSGYGKIKQFI